MTIRVSEGFAGSLVPSFTVWANLFQFRVSQLTSIGLDIPGGIVTVLLLAPLVRRLLRESLATVHEHDVSSSHSSRSTRADVLDLPGMDAVGPLGHRAEVEFRRADELELGRELFRPYGARWPARSTSPANTPGRASPPGSGRPPDTPG